MPYITSERVKEIRDTLKAQFPGFKLSVTREHHSSVNVAILAAPFNMITKQGATYETVNHFYIKEHYKNEPQIRDTLLAIHEVMNKGNGTLVEDGDYGTVPNFYTHIYIGQYDKPFQVIEQTSKPEPIPTTPGTVQIVDYSEKAIAVIGETRSIKDKLKELGGSFNFRLTCGPGWIFPKTKLETLKQALALNIMFNSNFYPTQTGRAQQEKANPAHAYKPTILFETKIAV